jgi:hypothetical protein
MVTTILSDELINPTDLRNNQRKWLEKAYITPISIMSGNKSLVLLNRDYAKHMYSLLHFAEMIIQFCKEKDAGKVKESAVFPWTKNLNDKEIQEFRQELFNAFETAKNNKDWAAFEEMLDAWVATAEAKTNPEILEYLSVEHTKDEYTRVE